MPIHLQVRCVLWMIALSIIQQNNWRFCHFKSMHIDNTDNKAIPTMSLLQVKYKGDLKKIHKPVTDMSESLAMQHNLSTSKLASNVRFSQNPSFPFSSSTNSFILTASLQTSIIRKDVPHLKLLLICEGHHLVVTLTCLISDSRTLP